MPKYVILIRDFDTPEEEKSAMREHFKVISSRLEVEPGDIVIGRYSVLPYYRELARDLRSKGAELVNTVAHHEFIADIGQWTQVLGELTPKTWAQTEFPYLPEGAYVLKGQTNSKKFLWDTHMFAPTRKDVSRVLCNLQNDSLIGNQTIYARKYVPLKNYGTAIRSLPITKEFRFFVFEGHIVGSGFYWSNHAADIQVPAVSEVPANFLEEVILRLRDIEREVLPFFVIDVAQAETGEWLVVDVNDGQMSGLSEIDPNVLYRQMADVAKTARPFG